MKLILASNSPRRKELLAQAGLEFVVMPAEVDERQLAGETPRAYVLRLAGEKAQAVKERLPADDNAGVVIIAADTTVELGGDVLGKPVNLVQAEEMLRALRGRTHQVHTAIAVLRADDEILLQDVCTTEVCMRAYSDEEMQAYIVSGDPLDKAGAYAIQHTSFDPADSLQGCYATVVGLPLCSLQSLLEQLGFSIGITPDLTCQSLTGTPCLVMTFQGK